MPLSPIDIKRAIYLDFESEGKKRNGGQSQPVLGGVMVDGEYSPTLLHPSLKNASNARKWNHASLSDYLATIYEQARDEGRRIVFFSSHELTLFRDHGIDIADFSIDLRKHAKESKLYKATWHAFRISERRFRDPGVAKTTQARLRTRAFGLLTLIANDLGFPRPNLYGAGKTGKRIRSMLKQAATKSDYESWSPSGKKALTNLINHNKHDCEATQIVLKHLADHTMRL